MDINQSLIITWTGNNIIPYQYPLVPFKHSKELMTLIYNKGDEKLIHQISHQNAEIMSSIHQQICIEKTKTKQICRPNF